MLVRNLPQSPGTVVGPGSDCAVVRRPGRGGILLLKTDAIVENVHFTREMPAAAVGWKALCRAVSDIAAAGGEPGEALVSLALPPETPLNWVRGVYRGMVRAAKRWQTGIAGGETSSMPPGSPVVLSVFLTGRPVVESRWFTRSGAAPGDVLCVTGRLGGSFASGRHLRFSPRLAEARWLARHFPPTAMMDLSDGLARDLPRLADASGTGWEIEFASLPRHRGCSVPQALGDGEDYELLFTVPGGRWAALLQHWQREFPGTPLTRIGVITPKGRRSPPMAGGWDHFDDARA